MRILIFTQQLASFRSGVGTYAYNLVKALCTLGHQITVVVPEAEKVEVTPARVVTVPGFRFDSTPGGWLSLSLFFARILKREARRFALAHFTDAREAWAVYHSAIPVTGIVNDSYAIDWTKPDYPRHLFADQRLRSLYYTLLRAVEKRTYRRLDAVITNSSYTARVITKGYHLTPKKLHLVYYGLPEQSQVPVFSLTGSPKILFVGGNFQRKGLSILLEAVGRLRSRFANICLHVVGSDRNQPYFAAQLHKIGLAGVVVFHGWQPNVRVRQMLASTDVFALPSFSEGFGLVYLEAMRAGVPVIATSVGGAREVFSEDKEVLFVEPGDSDGLASAIEKIISEPETARRLSKEGQAAAVRFNVVAMAKATEEVFLKTLKKRT